MLAGSQLQEKLRIWPFLRDLAINHNTACAMQDGGTARWFIQGSTFREWRGNGSLLWIRDNRTTYPVTPAFIFINPPLIFQWTRGKASSGT